MKNFIEMHLFERENENFLFNIIIDAENCTNEISVKMNKEELRLFREEINNFLLKLRWLDPQGESCLIKDGVKNG